MMKKNSVLTIYLIWVNGCPLCSERKFWFVVSFRYFFIGRNEQKKLQKEKRVPNDPKLLNLQDQLEKKREERLKAAKEMKVSPNRQASARTKNLSKQKVRLALDLENRNNCAYDPACISLFLAHTSQMV